MNAERAVKRALSPVTSPGARQWLIRRRNGMASLAAQVKSNRGNGRMLPDFLIIGTQKGGTTYLYQELVRHPQVLAALTKEVHYFSDNYLRGAEWYSGFFPAQRRQPHPMGPYVTGEASPAYLFHPWFPQRVAHDLPDARLVVMLRDPVKRAFSQYLHERRLGFEPARTFTEALLLEDQRTREPMRQLAADPTYVHKPIWHFTYRRRGHYKEQLERLHELVPRERVHVVISEEFYADTTAAYTGVCDFLGLGRWHPDVFGPNDMAARPTPMDEEARRHLVEYFAPLNAELAAYLGRELPWQVP